jgi:eukaryotic-like serine/threonine-protein kinase
MKEQQLGKYKFDKFLGGGMSHVYMATDTLINRTVVVKILTDSGMQDEDTKKRFLREARTAGNISHENIVRVYDFGELEGRPFMVMEYLQGNDLRDAITNSQLPRLREKLSVLVQLARAMHHIHGQSIIHRDLKPENVFLTAAGNVKLMDFGIAKTKDLSITRTGYTLGTPYYMAPEQVTSKDVTGMVDVYAFGIVMFELFSATKPYKADSVHEVFFKILNEPIDLTPLHELKVPPAVTDLIKRCTAKDPSQRPQNFEVIVGELDAILRKIQGPQSGIGSGDGAGSGFAGLPKPVLIGGAAVAALLLIFALWNSRQAPAGGEKKPAGGGAAEVNTPADLPAAIDTATGKMMLVKQSEFVFGEENQKRDQKAFYIDQFEVTNAMYQKFALDRGWPLPAGFPSDEASKNLPVVNVTFMDAREYAVWAGKRIPYAVEWEKAARGQSGRTYPWGYEHLPEMAVVADNPKLPGLKGPRAVGSWPDSSSTYLAMDLAGNVFEWVDDRTVPNPAQIKGFAAVMKPPPTENDLWVQMRGGSFAEPLYKNVSAQFASVPSNYKANNLGFRCVVDANVKPK